MFFVWKKCCNNLNVNEFTLLQNFFHKKRNK